MTTSTTTASTWRPVASNRTARTSTQQSLGVILIRIRATRIGLDYRGTAPGRRGPEIADDDEGNLISRRPGRRVQRNAVDGHPVPEEIARGQQGDDDRDNEDTPSSRSDSIEGEIFPSSTPSSSSVPNRLPELVPDQGGPSSFDRAFVPDSREKPQHGIDKASAAASSKTQQQSVSVTDREAPAQGPRRLRPTNGNRPSVAGVISGRAPPHGIRFYPN